MGAIRASWERKVRVVKFRVLRHYVVFMEVQFSWKLFCWWRRHSKNFCQLPLMKLECALPNIAALKQRFKLFRRPCFDTIMRELVDNVRSCETKPPKLTSYLNRSSFRSSITVFNYSFVVFNNYFAISTFLEWDLWSMAILAWASGWNKACHRVNSMPLPSSMPLASGFAI